METFAEVHQHLLDHYDIRIDQPFLIGLEMEVGDNGRHQGVFVAELKGNDERRYIRVESPVAPMKNFNAEKCMRANLIMRLGYLAIGDLDGEAYLKLCENMPYASLSARELDHIISRIASKADNIEGWLNLETDLS